MSASKSRKSSRARKPPSRFDNGGDEAAVYQAMRKSLIDVRRQEVPVPEAPTFYPTLEDMRDPLAYISAVAEAGKAAGIVRIVTPEAWRPQFSLMCDKKFETKRQALHKLHEHQAFDEGSFYTLEEYQAMANDFSDAWCERHPEVIQELEELASQPDARERIASFMEQMYWRMVERASTEAAVVDYGSDINTAQYASGFGELSDARSWDLRHLATLPGSLLSKLGVPLEGLTQPWLYFGMLFATFCWHTEDHFLYSINYHHTGAPKTWYGIPASGARRFEMLLHDCAPIRFKEDPDLVHQLVAMLSPALIMSKNIPVVHALQAPGDIIVTFPRAYHAGFSHGWNCAEACNFALLDWVPAGRAAIERYSKGPARRPAVFSHDKLLWDWVQEILAELGPPGGALFHSQVKREPPHTGGTAHPPAQQHERQGSGSSAATTLGERPWSSAGSREGGPRVSLRDFCATVLEMPPQELNRLPQLVIHDTYTSTPLLASLGLTGSPAADATLDGVFIDLLHVVDAELAHRRLYRSRGVVCTAVPPMLHAAGEDATSCIACGALPYFSLVRCKCEGAPQRCWRHADLLECHCSPKDHQVCCAVDDIPLAEAVYKLWNLLPMEMRQRHLDAAGKGPDGRLVSEGAKNRSGKRKRTDKPSAAPKPAKAASPSNEGSLGTMHGATTSGAGSAEAEAEMAAALLSDLASSVVPPRQMKQAPKRALPARGATTKQCGACGRGVVGGSMKCASCELEYHTLCVPMTMRRELAPGVWLCELCVMAQK